MSAVAKRYARAAVETASEQGGDAGVDSLSAGLNAFRDAYGASDDLREVLANPAFKVHRDAVLTSVLGKLSVSELAARVVKLLAANDRIDVLEAVATEAEAFADARAGRLRAQVSSAIGLTAEQETRIAGALKRRLGREVVVNVRVDPSLLGGLVCQVGDLTLDSSLKRQLQVLRERLSTRSH